MNSSDKSPWMSKKFMLAFLGLITIAALGLLGKGDPAAYGAIGLLVSVGCGGQAYVDGRQVGNA